MFYKQIVFRVKLKQLMILLAMGFVVGIHWFLFYHAIKVSNVSVALTGFSTITLFASVLQPLLLRHKFFWGDLLYGLIIFAALGFILHFETDVFEGILYGTLAAFTGAVFGVYNGRLIQQHDSSTITLVEFLGALVLISIMKFAGSQKGFVASIGLADTIYLLLLSVLCTTVAFTMSVEILKHFSPFTVIVTNNLEPVYGILFSLILFGQSEWMTAPFYYGVSVLLLAVFTYPLFKKKFAPLI